ncbi:MAG: hypothetical protein BRC28_02450 [Nanohaloarchaea archaeon SW_4_43_9]|nr:MAG: hypothetical protein BRC28_02450 [Nanohaloarchaea archaeon SW_4_43_9]
MNLEDYRREIDRVNAEIVDAVSRRMNVVKEISEYKKEKSLDVGDNSRQEKIKQEFEKLFDREELPKEKGRELGRLLIEIEIEEERGETG